LRQVVIQVDNIYINTITILTSVISIKLPNTMKYNTTSIALHSSKIWSITKPCKWL